MIGTTRITHYGHACILAELPDRTRLLFDPGNYLRAVASEVAVPIHQAGVADIHRRLHYQLLRGLAPSGTTVHVLDHGILADL